MLLVALTTCIILPATIALQVSNVPMTPSTPSVPICSEWVNVDFNDYSNKTSQNPRPSASAAHRTQSFNTKKAKCGTFPQNQPVIIDNFRSISNPDLLSSVDKERCSVSSGDIDLMEPSPDILVVGGVEPRKLRGPKTGGDRVTRNRNRKKKMILKPSNTDVCLAKSDVKILEALGPMMNSVENGMTNCSGGSESIGGGGGGGKWKLGGKIRNKLNKQPKETQSVKAVLTMQSSDDLLEQSLTINDGAVDKEILRSSSDSPQEIPSPVPRKKIVTGIFKKKRKNNSSTSLTATSSSQDDAFIKDASPPLPLPVSAPPSFLPHHVQEVGVWTNSGHSGDHHSPGDDLSPYSQPQQKHIVSYPITSATFGSGKKEQADVIFDLQSLVLPENKNWVKCGYLWLRMKLPNGRYAWTHIVSGRRCVHENFKEKK